MRLSLVIIALIINGSISNTKAQADDEYFKMCMSDDDVCEPEEYPYVIAPKIAMMRNKPGTELVVVESNGPYEIVYALDFDDMKPFVIEVGVSVNDNVIYSHDQESPSPLTVCDRIKNHTWDRIVVEIVNEGFSNNSVCGIKAGRYEVDTLLNPLLMTFDSKIPCGSYTVQTSLIWMETWLMEADFEFSIFDDGSCIP